MLLEQVILKNRSISCYPRTGSRGAVTFRRHRPLSSSTGRDARNYSFVDPKYFDIKLDPATDQHPSHSMAEGERFLKEVYETLRLSPLWEKTLLIITYDEHGGILTPAINIF